LRNEITDEIVRDGDLPSPFDRAAAGQFLRLANTTSRRSVIAWVGRAALAVMGGSFLELWMTESAWASPCQNSNGPFGQLGRASCMCSEVTGNNSCPNCCSGFWRICITDTSDPASCWEPCDRDPPRVKYRSVRLFDCCAQCSGQADPSRAECSSFGDNWCYTSATAGYCDDGGCCGPGSGGGTCDDWRVKCVVKDCTSNVCSNCVLP
jgi:hypothetical protein